MPLAAFQLEYPWATGALVALLVLLALGLSLLGLWMHRRWHVAMLATVASRLKGTVIPPAHATGYDAITFQHRGFPATLRFIHEPNRTTCTQLEIRWSGPRFRCEIYPESALTRLRKLLGMQEIVIGVPLFDESFLISGDRPAEITSFLTPHVRYAIFDLADPDRIGVQFSKPIHVAVSPDSLRVTRHVLILEPEPILAFIRQCVELFELATTAAQWGIEFLDSRAPALLAHCMVCGEELESEIVHCRRCRTPHHRECWSYFGGCSTYGCRATNFTET